MKYWCVGYKWDNISQLERFLKESVWEGWFDDIKDKSQINNAQTIAQGDILILKSSFTKGTKHDIPCLRISALAVVTNKNVEYSNGKTKYHCKVTYFSKKQKEFDGSSFGKYRKTIQECDNDEIINYVNINSKNMKKEEIINLLRSSHNLILTGAPGTGKTYLARQIAKEMGCSDNEIGFVQFHPSYDYTDFVEGLRPIQDKNGNVGFERKDGVFKTFCAKALKNFYDSKKSEDEISKEKKIDDNINTFIFNAIDYNTEFEIANGNKFFITDFSDKSISISIPGNEKVKEISLSLSELKSLLSSDKQIDNGNDIRDFFNRKWRMQHDSYTIVLYKKIKAIKLADSQSVEKTELKNFVFIIDEINRGEISKIFGELFFSIDPGYRGEKGRVQTQYQNIVEDGDIFKKGFFVPENVYIIGTMNDIDRSVEGMDFAFRRRFAFKEIKADENVGMLDNLAQKDEAINRMKNLNSAIEKVDGLSSAYHIGASYFLKLNDYNGDFNKLWEYHLEGLLREYLRGMSDVEIKIADLKKAYENASA